MDVVLRISSLACEPPSNWASNPRFSPEAFRKRQLTIANPDVLDIAHFKIEDQARRLKSLGDPLEKHKLRVHLTDPVVKPRPYSTCNVPEWNHTEQLEPNG